MSSAGLKVSRIRAEDERALSTMSKHALDLNSGEAIMIFVSFSGVLMPCRVFKDDLIESVKFRVQDNNQGMYLVGNQKLVCGGRELARTASLRDYGIGDGDVIDIAIKLSELQAITVKTVCGKEYSFKVGRYRDVAYFKKELAKRRKGLVVEDEDQELVYEGEVLEDQRLINDICKHNDNAVIHLLFRNSSAKVWQTFGEKIYDLSVLANVCDFVLKPIVVNEKIGLPLAIKSLIDVTKKGLAAGHSPLLSAEGSGGVYLMRNASGSEYVSVFKPVDEEPKATNNPHGIPLTPDGEGLKRGTIVGEGAYMEAAAYLLDYPIDGKYSRSLSGEVEGFSGVPPTGLVKCLHKGFNNPQGLKEKVGSLQKFMKNDGSCEDIGPGAFPVEEVHKISVLDMRLANADRHAGNILYRKDRETGRVVLIPIDHAYCLPESFEDCTFDWLYWPQAKKPYSAETIDYIKSLDAEEDIALLKDYGWDLPTERARTLRISTMLLKKGVERGLTPYEIGSIMCREIVRRESMIEEIVQEALDAVLPGTSEEGFMETVSEIMDYRLNILK